MAETDPAVVLTRTIRAPAAQVFEAWTQPSILQRWLAPGPNVVEHADTDLRVADGSCCERALPRHGISGRYHALEPHRHILKSWIYDGPLDLLAGEETLLQIDLVPSHETRGDMTELRLTHRRIRRPDIRDAYAGDWPSCFDKLDAILCRAQET